MKNSINLLLCLASLSTLMIACRKEDNIKLPGLSRFPLPQIVKVAGSDQNISAANQAAFNGRFTVGLYFTGDEPPTKFDVEAIKNTDKSIVKTVKANVTTFPTEVTITAAELATLFGAPLVVGDRYDISVDVTTIDGQKYEAFPITGAPYAAGVAAQPGSSTVIRYQVQ